MNTEISPTPWGCSVKEDKRVVIEDFLEFPVATTPDPQEFAADMEIPAEEGRGLVLANAEHIVRCVNLHDDLVESLQCALQYWRWAMDGIDQNDPIGLTEQEDFASCEDVLAQCRSEVK